MDQARGFTLVEFVLVMGVFCILLINMPLPDFYRRRQQTEIEDLMLQIQNAIMMARMSAITENVMVTFCRSTDGARCQGSWNDGSIIFTDFNSDRVPNGADRLLFRLPAIKPAGSLSFNSFRNRQYLQMTPRGITNFQNGNFTFCPDSGDLTQAAQLILSFSGRTRMSRDSNGNGIVENSQGKDLDCS
jgi:type IV fimbrial biogenesis protein FimT